MVYQVLWIMFVLFLLISLCAYVSMDYYKGVKRVLISFATTLIIYLVFGLFALLLILPRLLGWF